MISIKNCIVATAASFFVAAAFLSAPDIQAAGVVVRAGENGTLYILEGDRKRRLPSEGWVSGLGFDPAQVSSADPQILAVIPDVRLVKTVASPAVYDITTGHRNALLSADELLQKGFTFEEIITVTQAELESYPLPGVAEAIGTPAPSLAPPTSILLQKITEARQLLHDAPLLYPQEKRVAAQRSLASGDDGADVEAVQRTLQKLGYFPAGTAVNGTFGPTTLRSVKAFQAAKGITQNGVVGPMTRASLQKHGLSLPEAGDVLRTWRDPVPDDREVLLAVWNEVTGDLQTVRITLDARTVKVGKKFQTTYSAISHTEPFAIKYISGAGVNVHYTVTSPAGYSVIANRFPIFQNTVNDIGDFPAVEEVYVPYSDKLKTPEVVAAGRAYLDTVVGDALQQLRDANVASATGGLVADHIDPAELKNLAIIEHMDYSESTKANLGEVMNRVFATIGLNKEETYRFAGSPKGALGIAQFIRSSYAGIRKKYPAAKLIENFEQGMADHINAFKAMALYQDATGASLEKYIRENLASDPVELQSVMAEVRAAAYNGGPGRVKSAVKKFGPSWQTAKSTAYGLFAETRTYLEKFKAVQKLLTLL